MIRTTVSFIPAVNYPQINLIGVGAQHTIEWLNETGLLPLS